MDPARRIARETKDLATNPPDGVSARPKPDNARYFDAYMLGPEGTPYQDGVFHLELFLPDGYPVQPPKARFLTKVYHPNIDKIGRICVSILKDGWSPVLTLNKVLLSVQSLLSDPNPDDPLDTAIAEHWKRDRKGAEAVAKEWTKKYACGDAV